MIAPVAAGGSARQALGRLPDDGRRGPARQVLPARARAPHRRPPRRLDARAGKPSAGARSGHDVVGLARGEGAAARPGDRGRRRSGEPGDRHDLGCERAGERPRVDGNATLGGRPMPAARELRRRTRAPPGRLTSFADDPRRRLHGRRQRPGARPGGRGATGCDPRSLRSRKLEETHQLIEVDGQPALEELRARDLDVRTMGRGIDDDPAFFLAAGAAGVLAGRLAAENRRWRQRVD